MSDGDTTDVLVVTQFFPPESMGGAHRWAKLSQHLDDSIEPQVLTTFPTFPFGEFDRCWQPIKRKTVDGVPTTRLFTYQPVEDTTVGRILNYGIFSMLSTLYVLCTFWRYDCIVTMSAPHTTFLPGLVGKLTGRDWIIDIFDLWIDNAADLGYVDEGSILYRAVSWLERISYARADAVTVITDTMGEYYEDKYPELSFDVHVIPFGVDTELFSPDVEPADSADIIYTGNLGTGQAFVPFLRGFAGVDGNPELMLVGGGERRIELEQKIVELGIEERVTFVGYVDRDEIPSLLAGANVSLVTLKTEHELDYACPTKLLETMAVGTPYIASGTFEIQRLTKEYNTGSVVKNNPDEITKKLQEILQQEQKRQLKGQNGIHYIQNQHKWQNIGRRMSEVINSI
ncbi:glycosyltransferase family 4 protein [Halolamina rubra]|uniref:glycosyltransferase family 4 protein n=1 Tax=Halolamina rubra TaxID=1380430 RepID=UPI001376911B|nr:glycosyltransferase family 4 protein [Halolamina rubra]